MWIATVHCAHLHWLVTTYCVPYIHRLHEHVPWRDLRLLFLLVILVVVAFAIFAPVPLGIGILTLNIDSTFADRSAARQTVRLDAYGTE